MLQCLEFRQGEKERKMMDDGVEVHRKLLTDRVPERARENRKEGDVSITRQQRLMGIKSSRKLTGY